MKPFLSLAVAVALALPLTTQAQGTLKIGTIDMQRAFKEYGKTKDAEAKITDVVMEKVKGGNMDLVFDKSGMSLNGVPVLMYSRDNTDFTNDVVATLNKPGRATAAPIEKPATAPAASPTKPTTSPRP